MLYQKNIEVDVCTFMMHLLSIKHHIIILVKGIAGGGGQWRETDLEREYEENTS